MISLKRNVDELERREEKFQAILNCYLSAINSIQTHVVEVRADIVEEHRRRLRLLRRNIQGSPTLEVLEASRAALDRDLVWYQETASVLLEEKEKELREIIALLGEAAHTLGIRNEAHSSRLKGFTKELEAASKLEDLGEMRRRLTEQVIQLKSCAGSFQQEGSASVLQLQQDLCTFRSRLDNAERLASTDSLTGVLNRREGERRLSEFIESGKPFCLIIFDLDRFKGINDRYGHKSGDQVLKSFARRLCEEVRPDDPVCRWGGDEFLVIMGSPLRDVMRRAYQIGERLRGRYSITPEGREIMVPISASLGVAEYVPGESCEQLFERADGVLFKQKRVREAV